MADAQARRPESIELAALLERQAQLAATVDRLDEQQRAAVAAAKQASDALVALERSGHGGERISPRRRAEAERTLSAARAEAEQPWAERRAAARQAVEDARRAVAVYIRENLDALLDDLAEDGAKAAAQVDAAAQAVLGAYAARAEVEARTFALLGLLHMPRPGDVTRTRAERLAGEAAKLVEGGGERPPDVLVRPGEPRHAAVGATVPA
jgi:hypothetical protein